MKNFTRATKLLLVFVSIQFTAFHEQSNALNAQSNALAVSEKVTSAPLKRTSVPDLSLCKIRKLRTVFGEPVNFALFTYNKAGNPLSVLNKLNSTGNPDHYFFYDNKNRLTEWRQTYNAGKSIAAVHKYGYNNNGIRTLDTLSAFGSGSSEGVDYINVSSLEYDTNGRIIKETIKNIFNQRKILKTRVITYTYDSRGNLIVAEWPSSKYDSNISPLKTNPLYMFLHRNYSENNAGAEKKYNSKGLPLSLSNSNYSFFNNNIEANMIIYDCQ